MPPTVSLVTARAHSADDLTAQDYRDIYAELRSNCVLRAFVDRIQSTYTIGYWSKWENNPDHTLTRQARTELRLAVGLPALPTTVADATAEADPDATVYLVGAESATRIVMVGGDVNAVTLRINGHATVIEEAAPDVLVSPDTRPRDRSSYAGVSVRRATWERLNAARQRAGQTWDEFLARLAG